MLHVVLSTLLVFEDDVLTPPRRARQGCGPLGVDASMVHSDALSGHGQGTQRGGQKLRVIPIQGHPKTLLLRGLCHPTFKPRPERRPILAQIHLSSCYPTSIITSSEALDRSHAPPKKIRLSELLAQSDGLMRQYPPSSLKPEEIMGPRGEADDEEDDDAERVVAQLEIVVQAFTSAMYSGKLSHRCPPTSDTRSDYPPC
jgi:hypothetical protein